MEDSPRKRPRENESPAAKLKREKAAERQRRKRERDRATLDITPPQPINFGAPAPQSQDNMAHYGDYLSSPAPPPPTQPAPATDDGLTAEELARRERVRAAARERQRKHRQLVKQRKMRELGLDMGNEILTPLDDNAAAAAVAAAATGVGIVGAHAAAGMTYRVDADGQYQQVVPAELHQLQAAQAAAGGPGEPPFPTGPAHGGQTFATTLLLSFSCAPLLKQHLLRTLGMTNEELASLEPVIADAWDRWDQARRGIRYDPEAFPAGANQYPPPFPPAPGTGGAPPAEDFRGRFQRAVMNPPFSPFANGGAGAAADGTAESEEGSAGAGASGAGGAAAGDGIDPHLGAKEEKAE